MDLQDSQTLRMNAYRKMREWVTTEEADEIVIVLITLLGFKDFKELVRDMSNDGKSIAIVQALGSSHGHTVYKMLLARKKPQFE